MITSVNNAQIVEWSKLKQSKYQKKAKQFIIEEKLLLEEAKKANLTMTTIALDTSHQEADVIVSDNVMKKLSENNSLNDVIAIVDYFEKEQELGSKIVFLDNLQDPGNVGTIIRTAYAFGYDTVVLSEGVNKYNHKLISASKGSIFHMNVLDSIELKDLKEKGYTIVGTMLDESAQDISNLGVSDLLVLVFGNEGQGIQKSVQVLLDEKVYIPMDNFDSLNVAITAGIVLHKFR